MEDHVRFRFGFYFNTLPNNEEIHYYCVPLNSVLKVHNINFILKTLIFQLQFHDSEALAAL